jgi:hypothetical protein
MTCSWHHVVVCFLCYTFIRTEIVGQDITEQEKQFNDFIYVSKRKKERRTLKHILAFCLSTRTKRVVYFFLRSAHSSCSDSLISPAEARKNCSAEFLGSFSGEAQMTIISRTIEHTEILRVHKLL